MPWQTARQDPAYGTAEYKRARLACLRRARWRCQARTAGVCIGAASEANHVHGLAADPKHQHLQAVCKPCHMRITAQQANDAKRDGTRKASDPQPTSRITFADEEEAPS